MTTPLCSLTCCVSVATLVLCKICKTHNPMLLCRKQIEEQDREELLARRSNINWQGQVPHTACPCLCHSRLRSLRP